MTNSEIFQELGDLQAKAQKDIIVIFKDLISVTTMYECYGQVLFTAEK